MGGARKRVTAHDGPFTDNETVAALPLGGHNGAESGETHARGGRGEKGSVLSNKVEEDKSLLLQAAEGVQDKGQEATIALRRPSVVFSGFVVGPIVKGGVGVGQGAGKIGGIERVRPRDIKENRLVREMNFDVREFVRAVLLQRPRQKAVRVEELNKEEDNQLMPREDGEAFQALT